MGDVTLRVGGFDTRLGCADGDEPRLRALGAMVDDHAQMARQLDPGTTEARMLLMAALMLADQLGEARAQLDTRPTAGTATQATAADAVADTDAIRAAIEAEVEARLERALADELAPLVARLEAQAARWSNGAAQNRQDPTDDPDTTPRRMNFVPVNY